MKKYILFLLLLSISLLYGQEIKSHKFTVNIDVKKKSINVKGFVDVDFQGKDTLNFLLWKYSSIKEISSKQSSLKYSFDTLSSSPIMYIPNGKKLIITKKPGKINTQSIYFNYTCDMKNLGGWAKSFTEDWIELNFYSAWYPVCINSGNFNSKLKIYIDKNYSITGSGKVVKKNNHWEMNQPWGSFDNIIIAAKNLKSRVLKENTTYIETDFSELPDKDADSVLMDCKQAFNLFGKYFGKKDSTYLKFVIAPFEQGGGYSRKYFVRMGSKHFNLYMSQGVGHEMAHFWWNLASTLTWEDWLNEAFSEYSMLLFIRERYGLEAFNKKVEEYKSRTNNLPPIWGINRNANDSYSVLYEKGSLILYEFEQKIGKEKFLDFLKEVSKNKISTTNDLLELIEKELSRETRQWLENKLKTV